jgi:hypothetical protein
LIEGKSRGQSTKQVLAKLVKQTGGLCAYWGNDVKRAILLGLATWPVGGAIGALVRNSYPIGDVLLLVLLSGAIVVPLVIMAMRAPPSESWAVAIRGWLIGYFGVALAATVIAVAAYLLLASLR